MIMLLRGSEESENRKLTIIGAACVLIVVAVGALVSAVKPTSGRPENQIFMTIDMPYVGTGVGSGTAVVMHGVKVGEVTALSSLPGGGVRINVNVQKAPVAGLTDTLGIDFRPINYFGVTGINLIKGGGGRRLYNGIRLKIVPEGNFTLQTLLTRLGNLTKGMLITQLIQVVDKATRYTDALDPLAETVLIAANAVADTQTVPTARLLANATGLSVAYPSFIHGATELGYSAVSGHNYANWGPWKMSKRDFDQIWEPFTALIPPGVFTPVANLIGSHVPELMPMVETLKPLFDVVVPLIRPDGIAQTLVELRSRLEKMYAGTPEQRALQVRIVLDSLPGIAAPLAAAHGGA